MPPRFFSRFAVLLAATGAFSSVFLLGAVMSLNHAEQMGFLSKDAFEGGPGFTFNFPYWIIFFYALGSSIGSVLFIPVSHYMERRPWICWDHLLVIAFVSAFPMAILLRHLM